jgi:hypothetical protein
MTADVMASAIEIACLREPSPVGIASALIRHYAGLQNVPRDRRDSLTPLVKQAPEAFLDAIKETALSDGHVSNLDWLAAVIFSNRDDVSVRAALSHHLPQWLSSHSLSPDRRMLRHPNSDSTEKVAGERKRLTERLEKKLLSLTDHEREYLNNNLTLGEGRDFNRLHRQAFQLLSGLRLAPFGASLFAWAFGNALNSSPYAPVSEFEHLVCFNPEDWSATRTILLAMIPVLSDKRSTVGDWTVVRILRATGHSDDATMAEGLVGSLTKDREKFGSWRLVETYCETDPFDPSSVRPTNIGSTAERYGDLAVDKLGATRGMSTDDHFFEMAMPGIARFEPEVGATVLRRLATQALTREGVPRWLAVLRLLPASVLLDELTVRAFVVAAQRPLDERSTTNDSSGEQWATAQYLLFAAVPHLTGDEQLLALDGMQSGSVLLNLLSMLKAANESLVESLLEQAVASVDEDKLVRLLSAAMYAGSPLTDAAKGHVGRLLSSQHKLLRTLALGIGATTKDLALLETVAESNWSADSLTSENEGFESWYGSAALLEAAEHGLLSLAEALDRMALTHYGFAATRLGGQGASAVADRIDLALKRVLKLEEISDLPDMELRAVVQQTTSPPLVDVSDETPSGSPDALFNLARESDEQFQERQRRLREAYRRFSKDLTNADARLVLTDLTFDGMKAIVSARPDIVEGWYVALMSADDEKKRSLHLFAVQFASAIAKERGRKAAALFQAFADVQPLVRHVVGASKIPVETEAKWSHADIEDVEAECLSRLDRAYSDQELAVEVLAAFRCSRTDILATYTQRLLASGEPAKIARAITIVGFADEWDFADQVLSQYSQAKGFIGAAYKAAKFAYERNKWARHWYFEMIKARTPIDFWRYSVLFERIVDARFDLWVNEASQDRLANAFFATIESEVEQRIKKWSDQRRGKLFGAKVSSLRPRH